MLSAVAQDGLPEQDLGSKRPVLTTGEKSHVK